MLDVRLDVLDAGIDATKTTLRDGIISIDIWDKATGLSLTGWNGNPTAVALFNRMTTELDETLLGSGFPKLKDYYLVDLADDRSMVIIDHGDDLMQGWLLDTTRANPGILLGIAIPRAIRTVEEARRDPADAPADDAAVRLDLILAAGGTALWDMTVDAGDPVAPETTVTWTPEFRAMLGYGDESEFPNVLESWSGRLHPDHLQPTLDAFTAHLTDRTGKRPYDVEHLLQRGDGEYRWYRVTGATTRDADGAPLRVVGVLTDIHDGRIASGDEEWRAHDARGASD